MGNLLVRSGTRVAAQARRSYDVYEGASSLKKRAEVRTHTHALCTCTHPRSREHARAHLPVYKHMRTSKATTALTPSPLAAHARSLAHLLASSSRAYEDASDPGRFHPTNWFGEGSPDVILEEVTRHEGSRMMVCTRTSPHPKTQTQTHPHPKKPQDVHAMLSNKELANELDQAPRLPVTGGGAKAQELKEVWLHVLEDGRIDVAFRPPADDADLRWFTAAGGGGSGGARSSQSVAGGGGGGGGGAVSRQDGSGGADVAVPSEGDLSALDDYLFS